MGMQDAQQVNPRKLFVGNISWSVSEDQLRELFAQYGEVTDVRLVTDRMTGRSKGFAFVEYATEEMALAAVEALHNFEVDGRALMVSIARPPAPRADGPGGGRSFDRPRSGGFRSNDRRGGGNDRGGYRN
jgi:RNA recognition motif-containing protein